MQMLYLLLARVSVGSRHNKVGLNVVVVDKFENAVAIVGWVQVGRSDNEGCWSERRTLDDATAEIVPANLVQWVWPSKKSTAQL